MNDTDCIFDKIISKEIPASIVYEDEDVIAFLDISPTTKGHTLVVPKAHVRTIFDIDAQLLAATMLAVQSVASAVKRATGADGINIIMNNEPAAGQEVFHAHIHVIPRFENDNALLPPKHVSYADGEMESIRASIAEVL